MVATAFTPALSVQRSPLRFGYSHRDRYWDSPFRSQFYSTGETCGRHRVNSQIDAPTFRSAGERRWLSQSRNVLPPNKRMTT